MGQWITYAHFNGEKIEGPPSKTFLERGGLTGGDNKAIKEGLERGWPLLDIWRYGHTRVNEDVFADIEFEGIILSGGE